MFTLVLNVALVALVLVVAWNFVRLVPQGHVFLVARFGRYVRTLQPGLNFTIPFIETVEKVSLMEEVLELDQSAVVTKDNVSLGVDGILYFKVVDAQRAIYAVEDYYEALEKLAMSTLRNTLGGMELDRILSSRTEINGTLLAAVQHAAESWGINVTRVEIKDIDPPEEIVNAMERQMTAERDRRAAVITSEGEQQAAVNAATGRRDAAKLDAEARERTAEAEAKAIELVAKAIGQTGQGATDFYIAKMRFTALTAFAENQGEGTIVVPVELSALAGAIPALQGIAGKFLPSSGGTD